MKLSVSAYRAHASAHKKILSSSYHSQLNYGSTAASSSAPSTLFMMEPTENSDQNISSSSPSPNLLSPTGTIVSANGTSAPKDFDDDTSNAPSPSGKSSSQRKTNTTQLGHGAVHHKDDDWTKSNQRWMKLRTTVQISSAIQKKPPLKREDSFLKRFSTRQIPETQETVEDTGSEGASGDPDKCAKRRRRYLQKRRSVVNPDENFHFYWLMVSTFSILYNLWALIVRQSFPELQDSAPKFWFLCDCLTDIVFVMDIIVQLRTGYLEQGLMVYDDKKLALHYMRSKEFLLDLLALTPFDLLQMRLGSQPLLRFPRFLKVYRSIKFYYIVESRTVWPNLWRVVNLIHILLILAHWFGCFYYLLSEAEGFQGDWVYPYRPGDYATLTRKYLGSLYWSTLTLTTIGDLPTPETNVEPSNSADGPRSLPRRGLKSRLLQFASNYGYVFTIVSYLIGVFIFATIVGQVGNVITNRNANRLEFERLLDGAKTYMRHHKVPGGMKKRVLRWYDYSWSRGRIQGGGDINTALGLLPDKLKTELALHVNLSVLKKVTIFQECQPEFLHDLVLKMKAYIFTPGDSICRKGEVAREMFIIADGILEVLSETGKVLTTMKAGDFFGEIGILNLDGLNKRTADVRSVGYSELFSLSREDVLAAMKDYPEAQEILQTLGRKRLMEVRCVNKRHAKAASEREARNSANVMQNDNSNDNSASRKIVDRIRYDVKGIKSVLRKSRRSDESLEMQLIQGNESGGSGKTPKNLLKRMTRVKSDENHLEIEDSSETKEKIPSPIGAGLPLLQRLRLLKEKQDREDRAVKSTPLKSPPHTHVTSTVSPQESIQEEPESEVIGAGLPLLQRLQLLKAKEDKAQKNSELKATNGAMKTVRTSEHQVNSNVPSYPPKTAVKISFKEKLQALQSQPKNTVREEERESSDIEKPTDMTISNKSPKPSDIQSTAEIKEGHIQNEPENIKPWSKLKLATMGTSRSYSNLVNCACQEYARSIKAGSANKISELRQKDTFTEVSSISKNNGISNGRKVPIIKRLSPSLNRRKSKLYTSINDLSPEYSGLPFVKKLKILYERQKLVELETAMQTRSFSLDGGGSVNQSEFPESLHRSHSDASGISTFKSKVNVLNSPIVPVAPLNKSQCLCPPLSPESNETPERRQLKSILKKIAEENTINPMKCNVPVDLRGLLASPTVQGYVARHSKLMKSVTFNSTLSSPPSDNICENIDLGNRFTFVPMEKRDTITLDDNHKVSQKKGLSIDDIDEFTTPKSIKGIYDEQEYFAEILKGINNAIYAHVQDMHKKFQMRFSNLEFEIKRRDVLIKELQNQITNLGETNIKSIGPEITNISGHNNSGSSSSVSSAELLFTRGNSLDTILTSSPPNVSDERDLKMEIQQQCPSVIRKYSDNTNTFREQNLPSLSGYKGLMVSELTGNIRRISDSVILDIDENSSSSSSSSNLDQIETSTKTNDRKLRCNDWEVQMLAAELDKREGRRERAASANFEILGKCDNLLRRRRKQSEADFSETEWSETETEMPPRPRAASLDQFNLQHATSKGIFKSTSFDRDKDTL